MAGLSLTAFIGMFKLWKYLWRFRNTQADETAEIFSLRQSLGATRLTLQTKEETLLLLRSELESLKNQQEELEKSLASTKKRNQVLGDEARKRTEEIQVLKDEAQRMKTKHTQTVQLLETRTLELRGAETFLTKADVLSGADVIAMLNTLNSEIYQTAALVAESFEFKERGKGAAGRGGRKEGEKEGHEGEDAEREDTAGERKDEQEEEQADMMEVYASATEILGSQMVELLKTSEHHKDPTLIQIAVQAGMSAYTNWIATSWYLDDPEEEHLLSEIYVRVREAEEQAVSGRWRALTKAHIQQMTDHEPDLAMYFVDAFVNILLTAGVNHTQSALHDTIVSRFASRVGVIVKGAQRLRKAIGEEVTSCDYEVLYVLQDTVFDPSTMDDGLAGGFEKGREGPEPVVCTTELGLARVERKPGKVGEWDEGILLRPKIVLRSGIDEMMTDENAT